jgi:hypothetical protein
MSNGTTSSTTTTTTTTDAESGPGPGKRPASKWWILFVSTVLTGMTALVFYLMLALWPHPTPSTADPGEQAPNPGTQPQASSRTMRPAPSDTLVQSPSSTDSLARDRVRQRPDSPGTSGSGQTRLGALQPGARPDSMPPTPKPGSCQARLEQAWRPRDRTKPSPLACVGLFGGDFLLWDEQRLLALVLLGGALGGLLHSIRSLGWYVGNRKLVMSWLLRYLMLVFTGAGLAFVFYVVVRGGFFSPGTSFENTSPFGFIAFATLVGLFSEQAILKLKEISETLLAKPAPGANPSPQNANSGGGTTPAPFAVAMAQRQNDSAGAPTATIRVTGTGFVPGCTATVAGVAANVQFVSDQQVDVTAATVPSHGAPLVLKNPNGTSVTAAIQ